MGLYTIVCKKQRSKIVFKTFLYLRVYLYRLLCFWWLYGQNTAFYRFGGISENMNFYA